MFNNLNMLLSMKKIGRGFVVAAWNRYFRYFTLHVIENQLQDDLAQTFTLLALLIADVPSYHQAGKIVNCELRNFLRQIGFSKKAGAYILREKSFPEAWWKALLSTGIPPKGKTSGSSS